MARNRDESVESRMRVQLANIDYDFSQFTLEGFTRWLEKRRGRKIICAPFHFGVPDVCGSWIADESHDYIFYEVQDTAPLLQTHSRLHEMAHVICGHSTAQVTSADLVLLLSYLSGNGTPTPSCLRSVTSHHDEDDLEAEMLASLIQEQILKHSRIQELLEIVSNDMDIAMYLEGLGMN